MNAGWVSIIVAGGQSRRMGSSKACLPLHGKMVIEHMVERVGLVSEKILVVSNDQDYDHISASLASKEKVDVIRDDPLYKGEGPLAGIYSGMKQIKSAWYLVTACDMLRLPFDYLRGLFSFVEKDHLMGHQAFLPIVQGRVQPLAGLYAPLTVQLEDLLTLGKRRMSDLYSSISTCLIKEEIWKQWTDEPDPFFNMNHQEEYVWLRKRSAENHG